MKLEIGKRVRVVGIHRLRGEIKKVLGDGGAADVEFPGFDGTAIYLADELEPMAVCPCVWCSLV